MQVGLGKTNADVFDLVSFSITRPDAAGWSSVTYNATSTVDLIADSTMDSVLGVGDRSIFFQTPEPSAWHT